MDRLAHLDPRLKVAIIGGGWAGLAAAVELSAAGAEVSVFESARQLGGRARRVEIHGHTLDNGQHILVGAYRETLRLLNTVGADSERLLRRIPLELAFPGGGFHMKLPRLPAPFHLAFGLFTASGCTFGEKLAAVRFMRALQEKHFRLANDCTVAELLDRHQQHGVIRHCLWHALCLAALNTAPEKASAQLFANTLRDSIGGSQSDTDLLLPAADLSRIFPDAAADFIKAHRGKIHLSTRIDDIDPRREIYGERFDHVILAVAPQHAAKLLMQHPETTGTAQTFASYSYEPIATIYAGYPPGLRLPCPMLGLDNGKQGCLGQWVFDRGALCGTTGVLSFVLSGSGVGDDYEDDALLNALHGELEAALNRKLPQPDWQQTIRERRATFSCRPNLPRPAAQTALAGLWLAGDYVYADYPATLEGAVRSGVAAANAILSAPLSPRLQPA